MLSRGNIVIKINEQLVGVMLARNGLAVDSWYDNESMKRTNEEKHSSISERGIRNVRDNLKVHRVTE